MRGVCSIDGSVRADFLNEGGVAGGIAGEHRLNDCTELSGYLAAKDHEEALEATDRHAGRRFLPLAGESEVLTICQDFICVLRPRFDKAFECLVSVIMSEFVVRHKVDAQRFSLYAKTHTHACTHMHTEFALSSNANAHLLDRPVKTDSTISRY